MNDKVVTRSLLVAIVILIASIFYMQYQLKGMREDIYEGQKQLKQAMVDEFKIFAKAKKDSVFFHESKIKYFEKESGEQQQTVTNTYRIDSLVFMYWKYKAGRTN